MISLLAFRNIIYRPWRSVLLFFGYGVGVAVMIVLLSVGEALLTQARDEKLVGGDVRTEKWGGSMTITLREEGGRSRKFVSYVPR